MSGHPLLPPFFLIFLVFIMHGDGKSKYAVKKDKRKKMD
jgi:hypothetical protein